MRGFCPLASGSKGNCIYLGTDQVKILIDAGLGARAIQTKLNSIGVNLSEIDAILITHDHADHIHGLRTLACKLGIPIIANQETAKGIVETLQHCPKFKIFATGETFEFGDLEIHPFSIPHDTFDPVAFTIRTHGYKLGFCADLGFVTSLVQSQLHKCDYLYLEANHQPSMVEACHRSVVYKQRVLGRNGHLSNQACAQLLLQIFHADLKHVHLAHLSSECNSPETALHVVNSALDAHQMKLSLSIAPQTSPGRAIYF